MNLLPLVLILSSFALNACGGGSSNSPEGDKTLNGLEYIYLSQGTLTATSETMSGSGIIAFKNPVGEVASDKNIKISFELTDNTYIEIRSHADKELKNGVQIRFTRAVSNLLLTATAGDKDPVSRALGDMQVDSTINLSVDIHNSETSAHILAWNGDEITPTDDNALFNSDADGQIPGKGTGMFWGIAFGDAKVTSVALDSALLSH